MKAGRSTAHPGVGGRGQESNVNLLQWLIVSFCGMTGFVLAVVFNLELKLAWLCGLVIAWAIGTITVQKDDKQFIVQFNEAALQDQKQILLRMGFEATPFLHKIKGSYKYDFLWIFLNILSAVLLVFGFTLCYSILVEDRFTWESEFSFINLLLLFAGLVLWVFLRRWRIRRYSCPKCKAKLYPLPNKKLQLECDNCKILWSLMDVNEWC